MNNRAARRGQPLIVLGVINAGWILFRVLVWTWMAAPSLPGNQLLVLRLQSATGQEHATSPGMASDWRLSPAAMRHVRVVAAMPGAGAPSLAQPSVASSQVQTSATVSVDPMVAGGHQLVFLAALSQIFISPDFVPRHDPGKTTGASLRRWFADGWLLLRRMDGPSGLAAAGGSYGASQAGAVLRYRLATGDRHRPAIYLRASTALEAASEQEAALGISARPMAQVPLVAMAELRATRESSGLRLRPAGLVVTELSPLRLPLGLCAEAYGQAGYVAGSPASAFVDGQARIEHKMVSVGGVELQGGMAIWGGAQKGAARVDFGPTASLTFQIADSAFARLSADWRFRIAGQAAPGSGPALTLSAGF